MLKDTDRAMAEPMTTPSNTVSGRTRHPAAAGGGRRG
jgi:hypothetical protein